MSSSFKHIVKAAAIGAAILASQASFAQAYPSKPVNMIVPFPAGGALDFVARYMTKEMTTTLKQTMPIENVVGVAGALGTMKMLNATADGYTMMTSDMNALILAPVTNVNAKYKSEDFKTVAMIGEADIMLVARKDLTANTLSEFIALAKKSTDKPLSYCTSGIGSQFHLISEKFNAVAGIKSLHVPYNGFPPCITSLVGQQIDFAFVPVAGPFPGFIDKSQMKLIAITSKKPSPRFPQAPLMTSMNGFQDFNFKAWAGLHVSAKTPDDIVAALNKSALTALETEYVKGNIAASGSVRFDLWSPKQAHDYYLSEVATYRAIAKSINLTAQ